ncbi:Leucine rich repeat [Popillia japonica]|uniref:Leucine rich repeat n=1 Tax=Popillia japonica TaxID=7064 RepID=A0AAW1ISZ8_POPJA
MAQLKKLDLSRNNISQIFPGAFDSLELNELDLSANKLPIVEDIMDFSGLKSAWKLDLSHNNLDTIPQQVGTKVKTVNLSYNKIKAVELFQLQGVYSIDLTHNEIEHISFAYMHVLPDDPKAYATDVKLTNNAISCDCNALPLIQYFDKSYQDQKIYNRISITSDLECHSPQNMIGININTMKSDTFTCDYKEVYNCSDDSIGIYKKLLSFQSSCPLVNCSDRNLQKAPVISKFVPVTHLNSMREVPLFTISKLIVDLRNNSITNFTEKDSSYMNASELYLSNNQLNLLSWLPPNLTELKLDDNKLKNLDYKAISTLNNSKTLQRVTFHNNPWNCNFTFHNNPWNCNCKLLNFTKLVKQIHSKILFEDLLLCSDNKKIVGLVESNLCGIENQAALIAIGTCFFMFLITICVALILYYRYEYQVKVWLYSKPIFMWFVLEEDLDKDKLYDAFLSYSHKDEEFVINELLPQLEHCRNPYKLCIHVRDWVVGEFITKQIMDSVDQSRRTIVILSPHFLQSEWATMEFRTAHTQAMKEGRNRLIVILYGDIDPNNVEDEELRAYLSTNTYVKWGDPWFWKKLKYVLPHRKDEDNNNVEGSLRRKLKNKKMENIMVTIDKMDLIHSPATPNLGTPPAVSLDPLLLKGNALDFKNNSNAQTPPAESGLVTTTVGSQLIKYGT